MLNIILYIILLSVLILGLFSPAGGTFLSQFWDFLKSVLILGLFLCKSPAHGTILKKCHNFGTFPLDKMKLMCYHHNTKLIYKEVFNGSIN